MKKTKIQMIPGTLKLTVRPYKWMVGIRSFPIGVTGYFSFREGIIYYITDYPERRYAVREENQVAIRGDEYASRVLTSNTQYTANPFHSAANTVWCSHCLQLLVYRCMIFRQLVIGMRCKWDPNGIQKVLLAYTSFLYTFTCSE